MPSHSRRASHRHRLFVALLMTISALAWFALWRWGASPYAHALHLHQAAGGADASDFGVFVVGWTMMTVAMMLPTIAPFLLAYGSTVEDPAKRPLLISCLASGYLMIWTLTGVVAYVCVLGIRALAADVAPGRSAWITAAAALTVAGLYQFSRLKYRCLERCRSPFSYLMERWSDDGRMRQALSAGVRHGLFCVGCCWALMLLMLPLGASNLAWMLLLGVVMAAEKNASWGARMSKPLGALLLVLASVVAGHGYHVF